MLKRLLILCSLGALLPLSALAQGPVVSSFGPRVGFSTDPDQLVLGGQMSVGEIAPDLTFDPNVEVGFGDNATLIAFNLDMHYHFRLANSSWKPYVGAGMGINLIQIDRQPFVGDDTFTKVAGQFIFGAGVPTAGGNRFFGEMKLGLGSTWTPDLKLLVGWNFAR